MMPIGPDCRCSTTRSSCSPRSRWPGSRARYARASSSDRYGPQENQRVTCGSDAWRYSAAASSARGIRTRTLGPVTARSATGRKTTRMLALIYDVHGNLPALEAVLADAREQGADGYLVGGDVALFGPWPDATVARLRELDPATWIRGNGERWTADPQAAPAPVRGATVAARDALGDALVGELAALPESAAVAADTRAWHGSPVSDVRSFTPEAGDDEAELL